MGSRLKFWKDTAGFLLATLAMLAVAFAVNAFAHGATINDQFDATCRITAANGAVGSGCVIPSSGQYAAVLTNHHVATGSVVACEFWSVGHQSAKLPGQVLCADEGLDAAIVLVPIVAFAGRVPTAIPLAQHAPAVGSVIRSVGCPQGTWATAFQGHVTRYEGIDMHFVPAPANGRSGSAITNDKGEIVGLLKNRATDNSEGGATRIEPLFAKLQFISRTAMTSWQPAAELSGCGPNGCTPEAQAEPDMFGKPPYLFPGLHKQPTPVPSPVWPTLPAPAPSTDLAPVIGAIDSLKETIRQQPAIPAAPVQVGPDPATLATLNQHGQAIDAQGKAIITLGEGQTKLAGQIEGIGKVATETKDAIEKHGTLGERFAIAKEQAKEADPEAGKLKQDLEAAKLMLHDHGTVWTVLAIVAAIVAVVGLVHWLRTGHGLVAAALEKAAQKHPENEKLVAFSAKLDAHEEALRAKLPGAPIMGLHPAAVAGLAATGNVPAAAALTLADIQRLIEARLAPAPGQTTTGASPVANASQPAPAVGA